MARKDSSAPASPFSWASHFRMTASALRRVTSSVERITSPAVDPEAGVPEGGARSSYDGGHQLSRMYLPVTLCHIGAGVKAKR